MKLLVIDDNFEFSDFLCEYFRYCEKVECQPLRVQDYSDTSKLSDLAIENLEDDSVLFINVNLKIDEWRQTFKGIEFLTWLRIKGVLNHCVLYSFQSAETIARSSEKNRLLFSKGTTFAQLPNDFSSINLKNLTTDRSEPAKLKENIKPLFNLGEFRHRNANWWGVKQLWDIHKIYKKGLFQKPYPKIVRDNLINLNNAVGTFLYSLEIVTTTKYIDSRIEEIEKAKRELTTKIENAKNSKNTELNNLSEWDAISAGIKRQIEDIEGNFQKYYANTTLEYESLENEKSVLLNEIIEVQKESSEVEKKLTKFQNQLKSWEQLLNHYRKSNNKIYEIAYKELFNEAALPKLSKETRILLIDDNAQNGWEEILKEMTGAKIKSFVPERKFIDDPEQLYQNVKSLLVSQGFNPHLIMLDLRLFDELDRSIDVENLSGKLLLQSIKQDFKGIPVLITTASNKVWTYQSLINLGADAYWIKEGIDEQRQIIDSVNNYCKLLFLLHNMTEKPYIILRKLADFSERFERQKASHWSIKCCWKNRAITNGRTEEISNSLSDAVCVLKDYLHNHFLNYGSDSQNNESFVISGLINKIAGVYELVHNLKAGQTASKVGLVEKRKDIKAEPLIVLRNKYSHGNYQTADWKVLSDCIDKTQVYLAPRKQC